MLVSVLLLALRIDLAQSSGDLITGYPPNTDVDPHKAIDKDQALLEDALANDDFETAYYWYSVGGNSVKSDGSNRTIQGFSTGAFPKMVGTPWIEVYARYWAAVRGLTAPQYDYADNFTSDACLGTGQFEGLEDIALKELCKKGSAYQNVWMYVIWEMQDAIHDCLTGDLNVNGGAVHAWDEAVAFYSGSLEGEDGSGDGVLLYGLAEKRAENFNTTNADGMAKVNAEIIDLFKMGNARLLQGQCAQVERIRDRIVSKMTVPLIQGALRYAFLTDPAGPVKQGAKGQAEGWAFAAAVLPQMAKCDQIGSQLIYANMVYPNITSSYMIEGYESVKANFESSYECLGITCEDVGGLVNGDQGYFEGMEPCIDE